MFLSYHRSDTATMQQVQAELRHAALSVWTDELLDPATTLWQRVIEDQIHQASSMVVLLSPAAKNSEWVRNEIAVAKRCGRPVFPVLIAGDEDSAVPIELATAQFVDARQDQAQVVRQRLLPPLQRRLASVRAVPNAPV